MTAEVLVVEPAELTAETARELTDRIKGAAEQLWSLLLEAHERGAWAALGYECWRDYAQAEFGMSQSRAYQIIDQGRVIREIAAATGSTYVEITEAAARDIKPHLPRVVDEICTRVTTAPTILPPEQVHQVVREVVEEVRAEVRQKQEDRAAIEAINATAPAGFDPAADRERMLTTESVWDALEILKAAPPPESFLPMVPPYSRHHLDDIPPALTWLRALADLTEAHT